MKCGFHTVILEVEHPTAIRRTVAFAQAVFDGEMTVEDLQAVKVKRIEDIWAVIYERKAPVLIDTLGDSINVLKPEIVIDARIAKRNIDTNKTMAPIVIGMGPGFCAGEDVHAVIETNRGHNLGRVIYRGSGEPDTGNPGIIEGYGKERIIRSPSIGRINTIVKIGDLVEKGQVIAYVGTEPVPAPLSGVLRGLIQTGTFVENQYKIGDVDPRGKKEYCFTISDKARAVAGGVLEAILHLREVR